MKVNPSKDTQQHLDNVAAWMSMNKEYIQYTYPHLDSDSVVLDLGAYVGSWSEEIQKRYHCTVHAFEPLPDFVSQITEKLKPYPNSYIHPFAVGNSDREEQITYLKDGSTFFIQGDSEIKVPVRNFLDVLNDLNLTKVDLIKFNVENSEYEILEQLIDHDKLDIFHTFQIQFHREASGHKKRRNRIQKALREKGFTIDYNIDWVWESWSK